MKRNLKALLKPIAGSILAKRWWLERSKYPRRSILSPQAGNDRIAAVIEASSAASIGKMGGVELGALRHYLKYRDPLGALLEWGNHATWLHRNAGVYPSNADVFVRFCNAFAKALGDIDLLAVWFQAGENAMRTRFAPHATPMSLTSLEPYLNDMPWSRSLAGKRVLVVTPFAETVVSQYQRRTAVWSQLPDVLPEFHLETLRCPLSAGLIDPVFPDWFSALHAMREEMSRRRFDVAIIGAGAWGVPLASHAKAMGRIGIHLGGPTQLLFGIRGGRWDGHPIIGGFMNEDWVRPSEGDRPERFVTIENGCYW